MQVHIIRFYSFLHDYIRIFDINEFEFRENMVNSIREFFGKLKSIRAILITDRPRQISTEKLSIF